MVIVGEWFLCDDGVTRVIIRVKLPRADGSVTGERLLVDTAADRTALSAGLLKKLQLLGNHAPPGVTMAGIGGASPYLVVRTVLEFECNDGGAAHVRGEVATFTDPMATDLSILGRDVLTNFDVIMSRRQNAVLLLAGNHRYQVVSG